MEGALQRVAHHRFLYDRGGSFYFRRGVPEQARTAFGKREVLVSLKTRNLAEARRRLARELETFERLLRLVREPAPVNVAAELHTPERGDIDRAAREWVRRWIDHAYAGDAEAAEERARDTALMAEEAIRVLDHRHGQSLILEWNAMHFAQQHGWQLEPGSALHRYLLRTLGSAFMEAAAQLSAATSLQPRGPVDPRFSHEHERADAEAERLPKAARGPIPLGSLFDAYAAQVRLAPATEKAWRRHVNAFSDWLGFSDARRVRPEHVIAWKDHLLGEESAGGERRSGRTVRDGYMAALKAVFGWAHENQRLAADPTKGVRTRVSRPTKHRDGGLTDEEALLILAATLRDHSSHLSAEHAFARRWVPWLCAYSGARVNEMTQLRAEDIFKDGEVWTVRITPEAGSVKTKEARTFPLHSHLLDQGLLEALEGKTGPIFYDAARYRGGKSGNPQYKKVGERLAAWVREIGVDDPHVAPNHGWRHRFKTLARRHQLDPTAADAIQGHAPRSEGERYGQRAVELQREIEKLPRYEVG